MFVKIKKFEKTRHVKDIFYEDNEKQDIMKKYYLVKNIYSFSFISNST